MATRWGCEQLHGSLILGGNLLSLCCYRSALTFDNKYDGSYFPVEKLVEFRNNIIKKVINEEPSPCSGCPRLEYKDWPETEYLITGQLAVAHTYHCNISCVYCSLKSIPDDIRLCKPYRLLPIVRLMVENKYIDPAALVSFANGEPTINKDFDTSINILCDYMNDERILVATNATIRSEAIRYGLDKNKIRLFISLDSGMRKTYGTVKGKPLFDAVTSNLAYYRNRKSGLLDLKFICTDENSNDTDVNLFFGYAQLLNPTTVYIATDFIRKPISPREAATASFMMTHGERLNLPTRFNFGDDKIYHPYVDMEQLINSTTEQIQDTIVLTIHAIMQGRLSGT